MSSFWGVGLSLISLKVADSRGVVKDIPRENHVDQAKKLRLVNSQHSRPSWLDGSPKLEVTAKMLDQMLPLDMVRCLQKHISFLLSFVVYVGMNVYGAPDCGIYTMHVDLQRLRMRRAC